MYRNFENWLNFFLHEGMPKEVVAANFNIYEDTDNEWSVEIVGTRMFDKENEDWACDEMTDLGSRQAPFVFTYVGEWENVQKEISGYVKSYIDKGEYRDILKMLKGVGVGFVDGSIELVYVNP